MAEIDDAKALLAHVKQTLAKLRKEYEASLQAKEIKPDLLVDIKNVMENLRSALDYTARHLFDRYGTSSKAKPKIYFPYVQPSQTAGDFGKRVDTCIPGLSANRPDVVAKLESYQVYASQDNGWLPIFMELNNANKHQNLAHQETHTRKELKISSGGATMAMGQGASAALGPGSTLKMGNVTIPGGQTFSADRPPVVHGNGEVVVITWVSFHFTSNGEQVLPFLTRALHGVRTIVDELSQC